MNQLFTGQSIRTLDREILRRWPGCRGWLLIDASERNQAPVWVHARAYLHDPGTTPGFRIETATPADVQMIEGHDYCRVFVRYSGQEIMAGALTLILAAQQNSFPWLTLELDPDSDEAKIVLPEGSLLPLAPENTPVRAERMQLTLEGETSHTIERFLPIEAQIVSTA